MLIVYTTLSETSRRIITSTLTTIVMMTMMMTITVLY